MQSSSRDTLQSSVFDLREREGGGRTLDLTMQPRGSRAAPCAIWSLCFADEAGCDAVLAAARNNEIDLVYIGRLTMIFGGSVLDEMADALVAADKVRRQDELEKEAQRARDHVTVNLYARAGKHGRHLLQLQRKSGKEAEWSIGYDRAIERDRLCDWLRWQKDRFLHFLDHAAEHGNEALARMLVDEMFVTERRVKKEGRGAGGMRPLRMWRGD